MKIGATTTGVPAVLSRFDTLAKGGRGGKVKPVAVGTSLFYGRFQEEGTQRGVTPRRFLARAAQTVRTSAQQVMAPKIQEGDIQGALIDLARKARQIAASNAPSRRGKLRRSIKIQVGGRIRRR